MYDMGFQHHHISRNQMHRPARNGQFEFAVQYVDRLLMNMFMSRKRSPRADRPIGERRVSRMNELSDKPWHHFVAGQILQLNFVCHWSSSLSQGSLAATNSRSSCRHLSPLVGNMAMLWSVINSLACTIVGSTLYTDDNFTSAKTDLGNRAWISIRAANDSGGDQTKE
jgi:hypothetical protein